MGSGPNKVELRLRLRPELVTMQAQLQLEDVEQVRFTLAASNGASLTQFDASFFPFFLRRR